MSTTSAVSTATSVPAPIAIPYVALCERRRVVDAVPDHRDVAALGLKPFDFRGFVAG
ncbi:MAG: hypothetical protein ACXVAG_18310 [Vulcanimicrobiaceae bacterium]